MSEILYSPLGRPVWPIRRRDGDKLLRTDARGKDSVGAFRVDRGGVATSGDARKLLLNDGIRYSHILNPKTGWPVSQAPRSVTVVAETCVEAGTLSTLAMLQGPNAEAFLKDQNVKYWVFN